MCVQLLYNDVSPMENHHLASAFTLMREEQYNFLHKSPKKVRIRADVAAANSQSSGQACPDCIKHCSTAACIIHCRCLIYLQLRNGVITIVLPPAGCT